jgi:hypothetical protein
MQTLAWPAHSCPKQSKQTGQERLVKLHICKEKLSSRLRGADLPGLEVTGTLNMTGVGPLIASTTSVLAAA